MAYTILFRRGTDNEWTQANPILKSGELGFITDTKRFKIGDGLTNWNSLPYSVATLENGKVPLDQLPDYVKISVNQVSTIAQRNLLNVQPGDICTVAEESKTYIYDGSGWVEFLINPDLTGYATELYVDNSINSLNLQQYLTSASVNSIVNSQIENLNINQYATQTYVSDYVNGLDLPNSDLFQLDIQNKSVIYGTNIPKIGDDQNQIFSYVGVTGVGDNVFVSSSASLNTYPSASAVYLSTVVGTGSMSASYHNFENTAIGYGTMVGGGFKNVAIGVRSMNNSSPDIEDNFFSPATAKDNVAVGNNSLFSITTGSNNVAIGSESLSSASVGSSNVAIGYMSLSKTHDGEYFDGVGAVAIGASATVPGNNVIKIGSGNQVVVIDNPVFRYSDIRDMDSVTDIDYGLDFINELRPVEYTFDPRNGLEARAQLGFIASEVATASPAFNGYINFNSEGNSDIKALAYDQFIPPIVKAVQEVDDRLIVAESNLSTVGALSASVAVLSASVEFLTTGDITYQTFEVSSIGTEYFFSASAGQANPIITLVKGRKYRFDVSNVNSANPFALRESDSITNFVLGTTGNDPENGLSGSSLSNYIFYTVPLSPPYSSIIYQSVSTSTMGGVINLVDP